MVISLLFSGLIYETASSELRQRIETFRLENAFYTPAPSDFKETQLDLAGRNLLMLLAYLNLAVLLGGGVASYFMAQKTLKQLQRAHEIQSRFVSDASHELRTPLATMRAELEVSLRDPNLSKQDMKELLKSNLEEVDKLTQLSKTLLSLSQMEYSTLTYEKVELDEVIESAMSRYDKQGRIELKRKAKNFSILAHQPSVEELSAILIDNALKYSPPDSKVTIVLSRWNGKVRFQISNPGKGIHPRDLPHIFDRFYRADSSRQHTNKPSFGLGLSLAKTIVELHNGELSASSAPDKLTTFTVSLPTYKN
jgi:signal transduction histidine kinase